MWGLFSTRNVFLALPIAASSLCSQEAYAQSNSLAQIQNVLKKVYIKPEKIWIDTSGIYVLDHGDLYPVPQIGFDNQGVYCTGVLWKTCPAHHKWYSPLGGCVEHECDYYYRRQRD